MIPSPFPVACEDGDTVGGIVALDAVCVEKSLIGSTVPTVPTVVAVVTTGTLLEAVEDGVVVDIVVVSEGYTDVGGAELPGLLTGIMEMTGNDPPVESSLTAFFTRFTSRRVWNPRAIGPAELTPRRNEMRLKCEIFIPTMVK